VSHPAYPLEIATQERVLLRDQVVALVARGVEGYLGVLARHAPMIVELGIGPLRLTYADGRHEVLVLTGGILEVSRQGVVVLADWAERAGEIDPARAQAAAERARARLRGDGDEGNVDIERARAALMRALTRLQAASEGGAR
jgi:F-type H+-transporting ATPase subunit epsilon